MSLSTLPPASSSRNAAGRIVARIATIGLGAIVTTTFSLQPWSTRKRSADDRSGACGTIAPDAPAASDTLGGTAHGVEFHTLYLVGAEDEALQMQADIAATNALRATRREGPLRVTVIVVTSDAEADDFTQAFEDSDMMLGGMGRTEYSVVDLRRD